MNQSSKTNEKEGDRQSKEKDRGTTREPDRESESVTTLHLWSRIGGGQHKVEDVLRNTVTHVLISLQVSELEVVEPELYCPSGRGGL